ncbi:MAG: type I-G CRISPR-associated helicase/endonuclease Cas3g, partial [Solirubrobacteraceae bacterium]
SLHDALPICRERPPSVVEVPTGSGKTQALVLSWLHARLVRRAGPRRLVYALPMRTLVEQTAGVVEAARERLGLAPEELAVRVLMGGERPTEDWRESPEAEQVIIGTIDMLLSRALNRGYGESRFQWPIAFGLLNSDCRWVFDEVQLMGPARATSAQLDGLRAKLGTTFPCETIWVSATVDRVALETVDRPELGEVLALPDADRHGALASRLEAVKVVRHVDLGNVRPADQSRRVAQAVLAAHAPGSRSIVVLNTVERAQGTARALRKLAGREIDVVLLHSRFRPLERRRHLDEALAEVDGSRGGRIVVATQVIEAGVDVSARLLATETAPFSSIVQRLGRCNRAGEHEQGEVLWLDSGEPDRKTAAPYRPEDVSRARLALGELVGRSASPATLEALDVPETRDEPDVLRRRDLLDLFDTAPDLSGLDVDVSRFIRDDEERNVSVFFRDLPTGQPADDEAAPDRDELVAVPVHQVRDRSAWLFDHVEGVWVRGQPPIRPGELVLLDAAAGGYDELDGWDPASSAPVRAMPPTHGRQQEWTGDNQDSVAGEWQTLTRHLCEACRFAEELGSLLGLNDADAAAIAAAGGLHDVGKSHPSFQRMLLATVIDNTERESRAVDLWAKTAVRRGGSNERRFFRHELASALAVRQRADDLTLDLDRRDLVLYLVAAHHGRVRLSIRPATNERPPHDARDVQRFALGVVEGDHLPAVTTPLGRLPETVLSLECMELGGGDRSWVDVACSLRDDPRLGPFRLAYLEALVRIADWRASA